ncbi:OLC1v1006403C1 [Oldenlandia corymbosa var. corymbosa]|uniref:OLC1v1006403C1 n=1 Tax=Oldenlandia corymbosa var. corymbosa TaxID=529605 RepID=A0AAV1DJA3_OLDCO|nr:OLC1v1006403C1 [Oldenlandia corymbosa var. corymbosa]
MHAYPKYDTATTTLGFIYNSGDVMVVLDHSRTRRGSSLSSYPCPIENLCVLNSHLLAAVSGGNKYLHQYVFSYLKEKCDRHACMVGKRASAA